MRKIIIVNESSKPEHLKKYDEYLNKHIGGVQQAFDWINKNIPDLINDKDEYEALKKQINEHDASKYSKEEYEPYALYFNVDKEKYLDEFNIAWNHHQKRNPHHWQYWMLREDDGDFILLEMPKNYVIEMICDWLAFSIVKNDLSEIQKFYETNKNRMELNPKTRKYVEDILLKIKEVGNREA